MSGQWVTLFSDGLQLVVFYCLSEPQIDKGAGPDFGLHNSLVTQPERSPTFYKYIYVKLSYQESVRLLLSG